MGAELSGTGPTWRVLRDEPADGPTNMAADHALALSLEPGHAVLRFYQWSPATISLGRNQPARGVYDEAAAAQAGFSFVRRPTGGRAVLHDREVTYAVVVHAKDLGGPRAAYQAIHEALRHGLSALGVAAELTPPGGAAGRLDGSPCFADPAPGEIHVGGRKLVGSAQARFGSVILQHGSILTVNDQRTLGTLVKSGKTPWADDSTTSSPGLTLAALGVTSPVGDLIDGIECGFAGCLGVRMTGGSWTEEERAGANELDALYRRPEWTWRR